MDYYPSLIEIYDYLLITNKKKLIKSSNQEYLNDILKEDLIKRYQFWLLNHCPTLRNILFVIYNDRSYFDDSHIVRGILYIIDTYEELCLSKYNEGGVTDLMCITQLRLTKVAIKMIQYYGYLCLPQAIYDHRTTLMYACQNSEEVAIMLINTFGQDCLINYASLFCGTALQYATFNKYQKVIALILKN